MFPKIISKKFKIITFINLIFIFILILFGVINIYKSCKIIKKQANSNLIYHVKEIVNLENAYIYNAEKETNRCAKIIELTVDMNKLNKVAPIAYKYSEYKVPYAAEYLKKTVAPLLLYSAKNIDGLTSIFFDFDHEYIINKDLLGIWYTYNADKKHFSIVDNGHASSMFPKNRSDLEWYYLPQKIKKGIWSKPYIDDDLKINMITYSVPVFAKGKFLGVEGVDISTEDLKKLVCNSKIYKTGKIYLIGNDNKIIFAKDYKPLTNTSIIDKNLYAFLNKPNSTNGKNDEVNLVKSFSGKNLFAVSYLYNGFVIAIEVPYGELYEEIYKLIVFTSLFLIVAILFCLFIAFKSFARINKINDELIHKEKLISMGTMAAEVAHEINTPLGYLNCNIDTLKDFLGKIKEFMNECENQFNKILSNEINVTEHIRKVRKLREDFKLDYIIESIDDIIDESKYGIRKVSAIVFNLKNFSKDDSHHIKTFEKPDLIIKEALKILKSKTPEGIKILTDLEDMPPLLCNKNQMLQVFVNLIDNAFNAAKDKADGDKQITISCFKNSSKACIEIEDNGEGIEKSRIDKIFDAFYTTKINEGGTGLGLSVVYHIVSNKHNGEISVESKKGQGSKFTVKIPY